MDKNPVGRPAGIITYKDILYNNNQYVVGTCYSNNEPIHFIFDKEDEDKVIGRSWHLCSKKYISSGVIDNTSRKELFLHNLVANILDHNGKGQTETIDHINRIGLDNRKENLRILTQAEQNMNQTKRKRNIILPEGCEIQPSEIPRHIWYIKAQGHHGDRFAIEFKTENICWKTTSSKSITLKEKLNEAKKKLLEFYKEYPQLNPFQEEKLIKERELIESYSDIIKLATNTEIKISEHPKITIDPKPEVELVKEETPFTQEPECLSNTPQVITPSQWKASNIWKAFQTGSETLYKEYLLSNTSTQNILDFEDRWTTFVESVKGCCEFSDADPILKKFITDLRTVRHNALCYAKNTEKLLARDDRQVWRAETILRAFQRGDLSVFKAFTEQSSGEHPDSPQWTKRWDGFVESVQKESEDSKKKLLISKFLTAQRTKKYRQSK